MNLTYGVYLVQIWAQQLIPQHLLSRLFGLLARCRIRWIKNFLIQRFIQHYKVDMSEAIHEDFHSYAHFNAFFTRSLRAGLRSWSDDPKVILSPVDGAISAFGALQEQHLFQAKGKSYSLLDLLGGDQQQAAQFCGGTFLTAYLSPKDYHRVHMPASGVLKKMVYVPGRLFSVNPYTVQRVPRLFARNERVIAYFETDHGPMAVIMVGALLVASIVVQWHGMVRPTRIALEQWCYDHRPIVLNRGDEMGHFMIGSTVIVLFGKGVMQWDSTLQALQRVRMGKTVGNFLTKQ